MKKIAVINDLSGFGKCSISAALPIISALGIQCCALPTGIYSNQTGYDTFDYVDFTPYMQRFIEQWRKLKAEFDGILSGFITNAEQGRIIEGFIKEFRNDGTVVVVDPVMADNGEIYPCYNKNSIEAVCALCESADVITPNLTELCLLSGMSYSSVIGKSADDLTDIIYRMSKSLGQKTVVTTGINLSENEIGNAVFDGQNMTIVSNKRIEGSFSGTGDILSSLITAQLVNGIDINTAVSKASEFISKAIDDTVQNEFNYADGINFEKYLCTLGGNYNE